MKALLGATLAACAALPGCGGSSTPPTPVALTVVGGPAVAAAAQVNGGTWKALTLSGGSGTFDVPSPTSSYAVAVLCPVVSSNQLEVIIQATAADTPSSTVPCPVTTTVPLVVNYNVSVLGASAQVSVGSMSGGGYWSGGVGAANLPAVAPGVQDIAVAAYPITPNVSAVAVEVDRGVDVTGAPVTVPTMTAADAAGTAPITVDNIPAGFTNTITAYYVTAGGTAVGINGNNVASYALVAATVVAAGDYYAVTAEALDASTTHAVGVVHSSSTPQSLTLSLPPPLSYAGPTAAARPTFATTYSGFSGSGTTSLTGILSWTAAGVNDGIVVTTNYTGNSGQVTVPDLSSVPGFLAPPASGTSVSWGALVSWQSSPYLVLIAPLPPNDEAAQFAIATGTYLEP